MENKTLTNQNLSTLQKMLSMTSFFLEEIKSQATISTAKNVDTYDNLQTKLV